MLQGLSVYRAKCNEKGVIRATMICIRLRAFVIPSFTVSLYRDSRATKVIHCITVPSLFGEFYEIFRMKTHEHVRSSTSWYGAVFLGNLS